MPYRRLADDDGVRLATFFTTTGDGRCFDEACPGDVSFLEADDVLDSALKRGRCGAEVDAASIALALDEENVADAFVAGAVGFVIAIVVVDGLKGDFLAVSLRDAGGGNLAGEDLVGVIRAGFSDEVVDDLGCFEVFVSAEVFEFDGHVELLDTTGVVEVAVIVVLGIAADELGLDAGLGQEIFFPFCDVGLVCFAEVLLGNSGGFSRIELEPDLGGVGFDEFSREGAALCIGKDTGHCCERKSKQE